MAVDILHSGGWDGSRALEFTEEYDPFADKWMPRAPLMHKRHGGSMGVISSQVIQSLAPTSNTLPLSLLLCTLPMSQFWSDVSACSSVGCVCSYTSRVDGMASARRGLQRSSSTTTATTHGSRSRHSQRHASLVCCQLFEQQQGACKKKTEVRKHLVLLLELSEHQWSHGVLLLLP